MVTDPSCRYDGYEAVGGLARRSHRMMGGYGSIEGRRALREGARIAQLCKAEVFLLAVEEVSTGTMGLEGGFVMPLTEQTETYKKILAEGVDRLIAMSFSPTARLSTGERPDVKSLRSLQKSAQTWSSWVIVPTVCWHDDLAQSEPTWSKTFCWLPKLRLATKNLRSC
jgi:hypothetical protein